MWCLSSWSSPDFQTQPQKEAAFYAGYRQLDTLSRSDPIHHHHHHQSDQRCKYTPGLSVLSDPHNPQSTAVLQMRAAQVQEEPFLLTKEHGASFCHLKAATMARSWVAIPAQWCPDRHHGHFLVWHTIRSLFVLTLIALPLKLRNTDFDSHDWFVYYSIWVWTMLWILNYTLIIILVINFLSTFSPSIPPFNLSFASSLNCLNTTTYFLKSVTTIFLATKENKLLAALQRRTSGEGELWPFACKGLSHLQQLIGSINLLPTSLCHTTHQILFIPQLTLTSRNSSYYMCNCAQCWNKHLLFPPRRCSRVRNNSILWKNSNWSLKHHSLTPVLLLLKSGTELKRADSFA